MLSKDLRGGGCDLFQGSITCQDPKDNNRKLKLAEILVKI